jgi:TonB family protein
MLRFKLVLLAFAAVAALPIPAFAADAATCNVTQLATIRTEFPPTSQTRGEHGNVTLKVSIGEDGRAHATQVTQSSGYPALDKAAADSVINHWRFDVAHCAANSLPANSLVTVQFKQAPRYTVSGTVNRHRLATNSPQRQSRCDTARDATGERIVACLATTSLVGRDTGNDASKDTPPSLANRTNAASQQ